MSAWARLRSSCLHTRLRRPGPVSSASWLKRSTPDCTRPYFHRVVNHQRILTSWNALRLWRKDPSFPYQVVGIASFCGLLYLYFLEQVPVRGSLPISDGASIGLTHVAYRSRDAGGLTSFLLIGSSKSVGNTIKNISRPAKIACCPSRRLNMSACKLL